MTNTFYQIVCVCALVFGSIFIGSAVNSMAQAQTMPSYSFPGVTAFSTVSGRVGFFEQGTGRIYMYDDNISICVFIGQLKALGEPIEQLL